MKKSAGILVYKFENNDLKVLLCHFGGPYWKNKEKGTWSIPKGEASYGEKLVDTAIREFNEETNLKINTELNFLYSKKVSNNKLVTIFFTESDFDLSNCKSNYFELEFPKNSGKINKYPEMDDYKWFTIEEAKNLILANQLCFLEKLEEYING